MIIKHRQKINFPNKKYKIIYADPPWEYNDKALSGNRGACCKYKVQSENWISKLPVKNISSKNCILFLWVTMPKLNIVFDIIKSWNFNYKTVAFTWVKTYKNKNLFWGMGGGQDPMRSYVFYVLKEIPKEFQNQYIVLSYQNMNIILKNQISFGIK